MPGDGGVRTRLGDQTQNGGTLRIRIKGAVFPEGRPSVVSPRCPRPRRPFLLSTLHRSCPSSTMSDYPDFTAEALLHLEKKKEAGKDLLLIEHMDLLTLRAAYTRLHERCGDLERQALMDRQSYDADIIKKDWTIFSICHENARLKLETRNIIIGKRRLQIRPGEESEKIPTPDQIMGEISARNRRKKETDGQAHDDNEAHGDEAQANGRRPNKNRNRRRRNRTTVTRGVQCDMTTAPSETPVFAYGRYRTNINVDMNYNESALQAQAVWHGAHGSGNHFVGNRRPMTHASRPRC
uniref:Uncharacterized protein n=1 Tax=Panagrellus redivivus TaxID=6233 RepID=A0A7E4UTD2_PANRE